MQNQHARSSPAAQATDDIAPSTHAQTIANSTPIKPLSAAVSTTPTKTQKSASAAAAHKMERQRLYLIDEIHRKLTHFIEYPKRARRRGWEGEVFLAFNVSQRGTINNIHITRSSGYSLLDESAMRAMQKVRDVSWQGDDIDLQTLELELPILYQLQDG